MLDIDDHIIARIKADEDGVRGRLHVMLSEWLKRVNPPPTWKVLAEAMEVVDELKAKEIRNSCVDV